MKWNGFTASDIARDVYSDLRKNIFSSDPAIDTILSQIFSQRGKVFRPLFMALVGQITGCPWSRLRHPAMVIEAIHIASLIHDDFVDGSTLRRGKATLNARFSDKTSVLFGDYIFFKGLNAVNTIDSPQANEIINRAVERMIEGEIEEDLTEGITDEGTYLTVIGNKTASLFAASGELATALSASAPETIALGRDLGETVGMAFQIIDDTLDFVGETEVMGKPRLVDITSERFTLPVIHAFRGMSRDEIDRIFSKGNGSAEHVAELVAKNGGIEYAYEKAREYSKRAQSIIDELGDEKVCENFDVFFDMLVSRVY